MCKGTEEVRVGEFKTGRISLRSFLGENKTERIQSWTLGKCEFLDFQLESSLFELESSLIEMESCLVVLESIVFCVLIFNSIGELSNSIKEISDLIREFSN